MAAGAFQIYVNGAKNIINQNIDLVNDTIVAILLDTAHVVDLSLDEFISDIVADEIADAGYARQTLSGKTITVVAGKVRVDCADIDFGDTVSLSARYMAIAKNTGSDATSQLVGITDLNTSGGNLSSTSSDFDVAVNANGLFEATVNA